MFEKAFWEKILNKNRNDCKRTSRTGEVRDQDLVLNLDKALRLATNIWDAQNAADSASVSVVKFFNNYVQPMLSGKTPLATVTQQRDTYSSLSDAYLSMTGEVFQNHNRFVGCLMLSALSPEWREKVLKDVFTDCGDVTVVFESPDGDQLTRIVHSDKEIDRIEADLTTGGHESV